MYLIDNYLQKMDLLHLIRESSHTQQYEEEMKKFFPSVWNDIKGNLEMMTGSGGADRKRITEEENLYKTLCKGLNMEVRLNSSTMMNAFTYPFDYKSPELSALGKQFYIYDNIKKDRARFLNEVKVDGKGIIVFPTSPVVMKSWVTKGTLAAIGERERFAIFLHEVGHWAYMGKFSPKYNSKFAKWFPPYKLIVVAGYMSPSRKSEIFCDQYAKQLGYGNELARALETLVSIRKNVSLYITIGDIINKAAMVIFDAMDKVFKSGTHPAISTRVKALTDGQLSHNSIYMFEGYTGEELEIVREFIMMEGPIYDKITNMLLPIFHRLDKALAGKIKLLFPVK